MRIKTVVCFVGLLSLAFGQAAKLQVWEKSISPGLLYRMEVDTDTPLIVNALRVSPKAPGIKAIPELAGRTINEEGSVKGRLTPTQMAVQESGDRRHQRRLLLVHPRRPDRFDGSRWPTADHAQQSAVRVRLGSPNLVARVLQLDGHHDR